MNDLMYRMNIRLVGSALALLILALLTICTGLPGRPLSSAELPSAAVVSSRDSLLVAPEDVLFLQV